QSRLWENLVGRGRPFWRFYYARLQQSFPEQLGGVELERFYRAINRVQPSLIRIHADEVTYGMHVILRFELEQHMINGRVELAELPEIWNQRMYEYLGGRGAGRRAGRPPGRSLVVRTDRLLRHVPARHRHVGADLARARRRRAGRRGADRARRVRFAARVARRACARPGPAPSATGDGGARG